MDCCGFGMLFAAVLPIAALMNLQRYEAQAELSMKRNRRRGQSRDSGRRRSRFRIFRKTVRRRFWELRMRVNF